MRTPSPAPRGDGWQRNHVAMLELEIVIEVLSGMYIPYNLVSVLFVFAKVNVLCYSLTQKPC